MAVSVVLGTVVGQPIVTPMDLVENGTVDSIEVHNRVRFLMSLDDNNDASDGISISDDLQKAA